LLVALVIFCLIHLSGYRLLYARTGFEEHRPYKDNAPTAVVRRLYSCHYFTGLGFQYAVVPADRGSWCRIVCKPSPQSLKSFRAMLLPGYQVAHRPICRD